MNSKWLPSEMRACRSAPRLYQRLVEAQAVGNRAACGGDDAIFRDHLCRCIGKENIDELHEHGCVRRKRHALIVVHGSLSIVFWAIAFAVGDSAARIAMIPLREIMRPPASFL